MGAAQVGNRRVDPCPLRRPKQLEHDKSDIETHLDFTHRLPSLHLVPQEDDDDDEDDFLTRVEGQGIGSGGGGGSGAGGSSGSNSSNIGESESSLLETRPVRRQLKYPPVVHRCVSHAPYSRHKRSTRNAFAQTGASGVKNSSPKGPA